MHAGRVEWSSRAAEWSSRAAEWSGVEQPSGVEQSSGAAEWSSRAAEQRPRPDGRSGSGATEQRQSSDK